MISINKLRSSVVQGALFVALAAAVGAVPTFAQDTSGSAPQGGGMGRGMGRGGGMRGNPAKMEDRQLDMMTKQLSLSSDQVSQIKGIYADSDTQLKALRDDTSMAKADKRGKMMSLMQDRQTKVRGVLTDDQKTKLDAFEAKMRERRGERGPRNGGAPPPPAGQ